MKTLRQYLSENHITHQQAASQLGCARGYLTSLVNGTAGGKAIAEKIEQWSNGEVCKFTILYPTYYNGDCSNKQTKKRYKK